MNNPKIAIIAFSVIASDARVLRQIEFLSKDFPVSVIGYGNLPPMHNVRMLSIDEPTFPVYLSSRRKLLLRLRRGEIAPYIQLILGRIVPTWAYETWYWSRSDRLQALERLKESGANLVHGNDWLSLPVAIKYAESSQAKVVADLHEYSPLETEAFFWQLFMRPIREYVLKHYMPKTARCITVNQVIASKYAEEFGFEPIVVMNTPRLIQEIGFRATDPRSIHLIHHGLAIKERRIDRMIETMQFVDHRYHLDIMLTGNTEYISTLIKYAQQIVPGRVTFHAPVKPDQVTRMIAKFDLGFFILPATNYNSAMATPNKFFDFIHAGLGVCVGPSPAMRQLCTEYGFGVITPSFEPKSVAAILNQLKPDDIDHLKQNALKARQILNADVELGKLVSLYHDLAQEEV